MENNEVFYQFDSDMKNKTDEELIDLFKKGNEYAVDVLLRRYKELVTMKVSRYFIIGAEKEDIFQEGMIGLYKAIKCFNTEKQKSFKSFANLCIERQLITAIKTSNRQKHQPLNSYISLNTAAYEEDEDVSMIDVFDSNVAEDPLDTITKREYYHLVEDKINTSLSDFEKQVLHCYTKGESYVTIAEKLDSPVKSIDNAIQRIRKKAVKSLMDDEKAM